MALNKRQEKWLRKDPLSESKVQKAFYWAVAAPLVRVACRMLRLFGRLDVGFMTLFGGDEIKFYAKRTPVLFYSNHISWWDTILEPFAIDQLNIGFCYKVVKIELFKYPIIGWILWACGCRPIVRDSMKGFRGIIKLIKDGKHILIYPQGTRSSKQIGIMPFQKGTTALVQNRLVLLVPMCITGSENPIKTKVRIVFGKPVREHEVIGVLEQKLAIELLADYMAKQIGIKVEGA